MSVDVNEYLESVLTDLGVCGKFQLLFYCLVYGSMVPAAFSVLMMAFGGIEPNWSCYWLSKNGQVVNITSQMMCKPDNSTTEAVCFSKTFDSSMSTIVDKWDLTCDKEWIISTITTIQLAGLLFGAFMSGQIGDLFGRKPTFFVSFIMLFTFNLLAAFSVSWQMFAVLRFFIGIASGWYLTIYIIILAELTSTKYRSGIVAFPAWPIGTMIFGLFCWILHDWQSIQIATAILCLPWLIGHCFVPESYRWFVSRNKVNEAHQVLIKIAKLNGKPPPDFVKLCDVIAMSKTENTRDRKHTVVDILKTKHLLKDSLLLNVCWISCGYGYFAISFGVQQLSGNLYLNIVLLGLVDVVQILVSFIANKIGRKRTTFIFFAVAGITGIVVGILQFLDLNNKGQLVNGFAFTSKMCVNSGWISLIILTSEIYPTVVRNVGFGLNNSIARVGAMTAPQLVFASKHIPGLSYLLLGGLFLLSCICLVFLPETNRKALKDTIDENEEL
ncbi:OCTN [Mytilus edulis]|uniref:SLC22A4_5 n=1 Tax=Mytilus edulis TaxID=6550 RepID=A0A8S3TLB5_MYTED|nr:OCTN [Mytilus edulis]